MNFSVKSGVLVTLILCGFEYAMPVLKHKHIRDVDRPSEAPSRSNIAMLDSSCVLLQITRLTERMDPTIKLSGDGKMERWDASYLIVYSFGAKTLSSEETSRIFDLAESVPVERDMGNGTQEGEIYLLNNCRGSSISLFLEPLAPLSMKRLVAEMVLLSDSANLRVNRIHFLRAKPVDTSWVKRLNDSGVKSLAIEWFEAEDQQLLKRVSNKPYEFISLSRRAFERISNRAGGQEFFLMLQDSSRIQVGLWRPP